MTKLTSPHKRQENREELRKFHTAVEQAGDAIFITDKKGVIQYVNPAFEELTAFTKEEAIGKTPRIIKSGLQPLSHYKKLWSTILSGKVFRATVVNRKKTGELFYADHTITPLKDARGNVTNFVAIWKDITEHKELEKRKDEFISVASHELRTPITVIKAYTEVLNRRIGESKNGQSHSRNKYLLSKITSKIDTLTSLVNELLDISRIEEGKLRLNKKKFNIDRLIEKIIVDFQYTTDTHEIKRVGEVKKEITGDEERVGQVLTNLLTNAIKYSPTGKKIIVSAAKNGRNVNVSVQDFGIGISESKKVKIFDRFYRIENNENETSSGFGLGLYISAEIIKRHGGKIWVESKKGKGSTFCFSLPLRA